MNMTWLLRAVKWLRNPPSARMVKLVLAVIAIGLAIVVLEQFGWWPEWATQEHRPRRSPR